MQAGRKTRLYADGMPPLFPDAETLEDVTQQIVGRAAAGDLLQRVPGFLEIEQGKLLGHFVPSSAATALQQRPARAFEQDGVTDVGDRGPIALVRPPAGSPPGALLSTAIALECRAPPPR